MSNEQALKDYMDTQDKAHYEYEAFENSAEYKDYKRQAMIDVLLDGGLLWESLGPDAAINDQFKDNMIAEWVVDGHIEALGLLLTAWSQEYIKDDAQELIETKYFEMWKENNANNY